MVQTLVPFQELPLSKALITLITLEWLLVFVDQHVGLQVALRNGSVWAGVTLGTPFSRVFFLMNFRCVSVW